MDKLIEVSATFISAFMGLAYPIIIQIASNDKFSSEQINKLFEKSWHKTFFEVSLILSLLALFVNLLGFEWDNSRGEVINYIMNNSANGLLFIMTIVLIVSFLLMISFVIKLYRPSKLIDYLIKKKDEVLNKTDYSSFEALKDILIWSIKNDDTLMTKRLTKYFYEVFSYYRSDKNYKLNRTPVEYPDEYYQFVRDICEKSFKAKVENPYIEQFTLGGALLLGEFETPAISAKTYSWNWNLILLAVKYKRIDIIYEQWKSASQYFRFNLDNVTPEYDFEGNNLVIRNNVVVNQRKKERERFYEFYIAVGALLLYEKQYNYLNRIFFYSQSLPPEYPLFPYTMHQLLDTVNLFAENSYKSDIFIEFTYPFPNQEGASASQSIRRFIFEYLAVLFVRQFNIGSYYMYNNPTAIPEFPKSTLDKRIWLRNLEQFNFYLKELKKNTKVIEDLKLNSVNIEWSYIDSYIENLKAAIQHDLINAPIEEDKKKFFFDTSIDILNKRLPLYKEVTSNSDVIADISYKEVTLFGNHFLQKRDAFTNDPGVTYLNFHSFLAEQIVTLYSHQINRFLIYHTNLKYVIKEFDLIDCLTHLKLSANQIIISIGQFNFDSYAERKSVSGLTNQHFNETPIVRIPYDRFLQNTLIIIDKKDLPILKYNKLSDEEEKLYSLKPLIPEMEISGCIASFIDNEKLSQIAKKETNESLDGLVWQGIHFRHTLFWKINNRAILIDLDNNSNNQIPISDYKQITPFND